LSLDAKPATRPITIAQGADEARRTILHRAPLGDEPLSDGEAAVIERLFGAALGAEEAVRRIIREVRIEGDTGLRRISATIDGTAAEHALLVTPGEFARARALVDEETVRALQAAAERVRSYHEQQLEHSLRSFESGGLGQIVRPLHRVGLYVPGTTAVYPSSVLHTAIPAQVAGVDEVWIASPVSPPSSDSAADAGAQISPLKLVAAEIAGVHNVIKVGGAQAIAAMAYGTETIPAVDKIFGPGGRFVTLAKRQVYGDVGIDAIYGPTETVIVADDSANAELVAADLLAQAEHDPLAAPLLITPSLELATAVADEIGSQAADLERGGIALQAFANRGGIAVVEDVDVALDLANEYAPEHLALVVRDADKLVDRVRNAGGLFIGESSPEALADYTAGPSHVMPTGGSARFASPLHVGEFLKITSVVRASDELLQEIAPHAARIAHAEHLTAHARSLEIRQDDR
jgi:histidinol dehydrogenase